MAQPRRRATRTSRGRGPGVSWLWLAALVLIGIGVVAARTAGRQEAAETRTAVPTTVAPTAAPTRAPARTPTPQAAAERRLELASPTATSRPRAVATPTTVHAATGTSAVQPHRTATATVATTPTHTAQPTVVTTVVVQRPVASAPTLVAPHGAAGVVALTFDAGADRGYAQDILDRLAEEHVVASFGITGNWAKANADLVRRMAAEGHLVFNHTLDHRSFTGLSDSLGGLSAAARRSEVDQADAIIAPLIGHTTRPFYRLPYGDDDARVAADLAPDGYTRKIGWTVDSLGWRGALAQDIIARCVKLAAPGAVYVFHVGRASQDANALPSIISGLRERGLGFARVDEL